MPTWRSLAAAVLALVAGAEGLAQAPARRPVVGRVSDSGGPIVGAKVTLVGFPSHLDPQRDAADVVEAVTDARGQYRAPVVVGLPYFGFACGPATDTGAVARAELRGWFGAGAIVDFQCTAPDGPFETRIEGLPAWSNDGALSFWAWPGTRGYGVLLPYAVAVVDDGQGRVTWPALPRGSLEVRAGAGPLWWIQAPPPFTAIPAPQVVACSVVDELGAPIAGAELRVRSGAFSDQQLDGIETMRWPRTRLLARTGADGTALLRLPAEGDVFARSAAETLMFTARAPGRVERVGSLAGSKGYRDDRLVEADGERTLRFTLAPSKPLLGTVRHLDRPAGEGATVRAYVTAKLHAQKAAGYMHDPRAYDGTVDAAGRFAIDGLPDDPHACRVVLLPRDAGPPSGGLPFGWATMPGRQETQDFDLAVAATLRLAVLDVRHGPAAGQAVYLQQLPGGRIRSSAKMRSCVDGAGRAEWQLAGGDWFLFAADDTGVAWASVALGAGTAREAELVLQPYPVLRGTLTDQDGRPCAGAKVHVRGQQNKSADTEVMLARSYFAERLGRLVRGTTTQADGSFAIPCAPLDGYVMTVQLIGDGKRTDAFEVSPDKSPLQVRLQ